MFSAKKYKVAILMSHPIHYLVDLYKELNKHPAVETRVYFCSDFGIKPGFDTSFGKTLKWYDESLLNDLPHKFLKNYSLGKTVGKFFSIFNPSIISELKKNEHDALVIHGYNYATNIIAVFTARILKIPIFFRGESHLLNRRVFFTDKIKKMILPPFFRKIDAFLAIGRLNADYYKFYGVNSEKIFLVPYAVNNRYFQEMRKKLPEARVLKEKYGLAADSIVILYLAKLIKRKKPLDLIRAFEEVKKETKSGRHLELALVGDGPEKNTLEAYAEKKKLEGVHFFGFKKPEELSEFYKMADVFVLPSSFETWGMAVNEAMGFGLPIIATDMVGAVYDLVKNGENGFIYKAGDVNALAYRLKILTENQKVRKKMEKNSLQIVAEWSFEKAIRGIVSALEFLAGPKIIVANPGSHHLWRTAVAFQNAGLLKNYATGFYYFPKKLLFKLLKFFPSFFREFKKRKREKLKENKIKTFWFHEMIYLLSERFLKSKNFSQKLIDIRNKNFSIKTGKLALSEKASLLWSALDGSREAFLIAKKAEITCVLDQFIGHPAVLNKILQEEIGFFPELKNVTKDFISQQKLKRLEDEMKLADFIVVGSEFARKTLLENGILPQKVFVIPYGADDVFYELEPARGEKNEIFNILFVGNISVRKGCHYLLKAMRGLNSSRFKLKMVGQMEDKYFLKEFGNYFEWVPKVDSREIAKFYKQADIYVYPSLFEGSSLSIYEALASGLPVITTENSGSVVRDGRDGFIIPVRDAEAIKERLLFLSRNEKKRRAMSENVRKQAENYRWEDYYKRVGDFVKEITKS